MTYYILLFFILLFIILMIYLIILINQQSKKKILTCFDKRFGCCSDNYTPKLDINGSNCRGF